MSKVKDRNEPAEQLLAVLDILWDELQQRVGDDQGEAPPAPSVDEVNTALWQVHELVFAMAAELDRTYEVLEAALEDAQQRKTVGSILFGPDGQRIQ